MRYKGFIAAALLFLSLTACGQSGDCRFQEGDRVCFIGDSITHSGTYHSLVYLYYATRFPQKKVYLYNCGIGGDTAAGVIQRFDWDIEPYKPTAAAVMLGMNDAGRTDYGKAAPTAQQTASRNEHVKLYRENMEKLADRLKGLCSKVIFITPSIYDQTAAIEALNNYGVNDALKLFADFNADLAKAHGGCLVDFHNPMRSINQEYQKSDNTRTIVGGDRIHPGRVGNFIMAYLFLKSQGMSEYVSKITVNTNDKKCVTLNCDVKGLEVSDKGVEFECLAASLPFPVPEDAKKALEPVDFTNSLNKEIIQIEGLGDADYELTADTAVLGTFSVKELAQGVNLAVIEQSPSYRQALKVAELNERRRQIEFDLRTILFVEHKMLNKRIVEPFDMSRLKIELEKLMRARENTSTYDNYRRKVELYYQMKHKEQSMRQEIDSLIDAMYSTNKPTAHKYRIRAVN